MNTWQVPRWTKSDRLRKAREFAGLEQAELAKRAGISRGSVGNYERGLRGIPTTVVQAWALVTGVDPKWIEAGEESESMTHELLDDLDRWLRARRDSNPQPSDLESLGLAA